MQLKTQLLVLSALIAAGCSNSQSNIATPVTNAAVVATFAPDYSSGAVSLVQTTAPYTAQNSLNATISDISIRAAGDHFFLIKRFGSDQISRYESSAPNVATYTYSTNDSNSQDSNPYDIVELNSTKAYLIRYGSATVWIVNPSASSEANFKIGEIDLSGYDSDGIPDMSAGLISNGKLYVAMQRLQGYAATQPGYVAVIDTATDTEITTGDPDAPLKGIQLPVNDPYRLVAVPGSNKIIVGADGGYIAGNDGSFNQQYNGGIVAIDPDNGYATGLLVDDGNDSNHPYGILTDVSVAAADRGYFVGSTSFGGAASLYRFDLTGGVPPTAVSGFQNLELGPISVNPADGSLWVGQTSSSAPGLSVLGFQNGTETVVEPLIDTVLNPQNIDFVTTP